MINLKVRVCLQKRRGLHAKLMDDGLILGNQRGLLTKFPHERVSGFLGR
jgi:hypothetical protein